MRENMQGARILLLFICLFPALHAVALVEEAAADNTALAPLLLGAQNACNVPERQATADDIFSVAGIRAVAVVPEVDGITSDAAAPGLLWSWSAAFPKEAAFALPSDGGCPQGNLEYYTPSGVALEDGLLRYKYGNATKEIRLGATGPNPVALELDSSLLGNGDLAGIYASLPVHLEADISVEYSYKKTEYAKECRQIGDYLACGCVAKTASGMKMFKKAVADERNFSVEVGPVEEMWLNPPLQKRLDGGGAGKLLFFARRMPSNISIVADGAVIGFSEPYGFEAVRGGCGEARVVKKFAPHGKDTFLNMSGDSVVPFQLVEKNLPYLPFYLEFGWNATPGNKTLAIVFEDCFSKKENFTREFSIREPAAFVPEGKTGGAGAMEMRGGSDDSTPAAYPAQARSAEYPDFSPLAILFALPFALLAGALIKNRA